MRSLSKVEGFEIHSHMEDYDLRSNTWDMSKRWTYSLGQIHYDPDGLIADCYRKSSVAAG